MFCNVQLQSALLSGGYRFLSVLGALALFDLMVRYPVFSINVSRCFQHTHREGSNPSRLPFVWVSLRRCQFLCETIERNCLFLFVFYPLVDSSDATSSQLLGFQHREHELAQI